MKVLWTLKTTCSITIRHTILMAFKDAVKEGNGEHQHEMYQLILLLYKANGYHKYAYVTLFHLVKLSALCTKFEAHSQNVCGVMSGQIKNNKMQQGLLVLSTPLIKS